MVREIVREGGGGGGSVTFPTLTKTNYQEWRILMRIALQGAGLWEAVDTGDATERQERQALGAILRSVPPEMVPALAAKDDAKIAWDTLTAMRVGDNRVREARRQKLRKDFDALAFKSGESVEDFALRLSSLLSELQSLGDNTTQLDAVQKLLRVVPPRYAQMACSIETLLDLSTLSIEELSGRLAASEGRGAPEQDAGGRLLLTEEEWASRQQQRGRGSSSAPKGSSRQKPQGGGDKEKGAVNAFGSGGNTAPRRAGNCRYCGKPGHWAKECRKAARNREKRGEVANLANAEEEEQPGLLMAQACTLVQISDAVDALEVNLNEERVVPVPSPAGVWYLDSGASSHMTGCRNMFTTLDESVHGTVRFGDGSVVKIQGRGTVVFECLTGDHRVLGDVYFIPSLRSNIVSLGQLDENGCKITIEGGVMCILDRSRKILARVTRTGNRLYTVRLQIASPVSLLAQKDDVAWLWHGRYGHLHFRALHSLAHKGLVRGMPPVEHVEEFCDGCAMGKQHRTPFPRATAFRAEKPLELVHMDLCGPITPPTAGGKKYFLLLVDDHSRYMWVELIRSKDEALRFFKKVKALAENERGSKLLAFRSDRGGEFNSAEFSEFCEENGVKHFTTAPYTPQQNGVVERRNQTVVEMARCLLKAMAVPGPFWGEAVKTAVYLLNRAPSRSLNGVTPYEAWHGRKPNVHHLRTFGCTAHVKKLGPGQHKLADRSTPGIFVGYEEGAKAYRVYDPVGERIYVTRDVAFEERRAWSWDTAKDAHKLSAPSTFIIEYTIEHVVEERAQSPVSTGTASAGAGAGSETELDTGTPAHGTATPSTPRVEFATPRSHDSNLDTDSGGPHRYRRVTNLYDTTLPVEEEETLGLITAEEPASLDAALADPAWRSAMEAELKSIEDNATWSPSSLPKGHRAIGLKWVFKVKRDPAGAVVKHKARLVAKGYSQRQGVDFDEVFAPVARLETVRLLLALAAHGKWEVHHMDVKSAFLNGVLTEEVYVQQPPGFAIDKDATKVLKLDKALYGLRQAPRAWNAKLDATLVSLGFTRCSLEHGVYRRGNSESFLLVGVYVDDLVITGSNTGEIIEFKTQMKQMFEMSDLGLLSYYLGIEVQQRQGEITLTQAAYAGKILERAGLSTCNPCSTPMEQRLQLQKVVDGTIVDATEYRSVIGSLRYLVNTRPDIAHAVGVVSRHMEAPGKEHWAAVKQILRYIRGTQDFGCRYVHGGAARLVGFSDSDHAGDINDRKSTTGFVFFFNNNLISWCSQKQGGVSTSSCEAEYVAAAAAACQGVWLNRLVGELIGKEQPKFKLFIDNKSAIALCKNPVHHSRSKHIDTKFHYTREQIEDGVLEVEHVSTEEQLADILTKALGRNKFVEFRQKIGVLKIKQQV